MYYICHCGYDINYHPFKHSFEPLIKVEKDGNQFIINALEYPEKIRENGCSVVDCGKSRELHNPKNIKHDFKQSPNTTYRNIVFRIPENTPCLYRFTDISRKKDKREICLTTVMEHTKEQTHHFHSNIRILNKQDEDVVELIHPDDVDIKIINIANL